jgi:hypothetical protein
MEREFGQSAAGFSTIVDTAWASLPTHDGTSPITIPAGSRIVINMRMWRNGNMSNCSQSDYRYNRIFTANTDYPDFRAWFEGDGIDTSINSGTNWGDCVSVTNYYDPNIIGPTEADIASYINNASVGGTTIVGSVCEFFWTWQSAGAGIYNLIVTGPQACIGGRKPNDRKSKIEGSITIYRAIDTFIFETMPKDSLPDVFFENHLSFDIDQSGNHFGNVQNQNIAGGTPAIVNTEFFNCFTFGNGVESYKAFDSITSKAFNLGERVTSVAAQDYKAARRHADITYSGVYNNETNVNKLNEFNLGLLNFKPLEASFGRIFKMDARETDVLVLQEDKISYVLAGKNLLSDAAAGGVIASVPEVLGTQIARVEKYGISFNPESYVHWGYDRYFTDAKRGAVIQLKGGSYNSDQLRVVSEQGMRTWFRDEFNASFNTQKLGGFDPYMNEYVLSTNERSVIGQVDCVDCGFTNTFVVTGTSLDVPALSFCTELGSGIGETDIIWSSSGSGTFTVATTYNGDTDIVVGSAGKHTFIKGSAAINTADIVISVNGSLTINMTVNCPKSETFSIVEVVITSTSDSGNTIHTEYRYNDPSTSYISPTQSSLVTFGSNNTAPYVVSRYNVSSGPKGSAAFPTDISLVTIQTNKIAPDTYDFVPNSNRLLFYRDSTLYANSIAGIDSLLAVAVDLNSPPPSTSGNITYASFQADAILPVPNDYLYLIWDLRRTETVSLCYGLTIDSVCCDCQECNDCLVVRIKNNSSDDVPVSIQVILCGDTDPTWVNFAQGQERYLCIAGDPVFNIRNMPRDFYYQVVQCGCQGCVENCTTYLISDIVPYTEIELTNCSSPVTNNPSTIGFVPSPSNVPPIPSTYKVCGQTGMFPKVVSGTGSATITAVDCGCIDCDNNCYRFDIAIDEDYPILLPFIYLNSVTIGPNTYIVPTSSNGIPEVNLSDTEQVLAFLNNTTGADCSVGGSNLVKVNSFVGPEDWGYVDILQSCCGIAAITYAYIYNVSSTPPFNIDVHVMTAFPNTIDCYEPTEI